MGEPLAALDDLPAWAKEENEPNLWFQRFERFRRAGPGRTIEDTWAGDANRGKARRPSSRWYQVASLWRWRARAEAWDKYISDRAAAEAEAERLRVEAEWIKKHMGSAEALARLAEQGRADLGRYFKISERWSENPAPAEEIFDERKALKVVDDEEVVVTEYLVRKVVLDTAAMVDPERSWLVKKFTDSPKNGLSIELLDPQAALRDVGRHLKIFTDQIEHSGNVPVQSAFESLESRQLEELIHNLLAAAAAGSPGTSPGGADAPPGAAGPHGEPDEPGEP